jgi:DNA polymerase-4
MDCFYAAIEMRDFPELLDKPIAVGRSIERRGVIATCNYLARQFGVHSAMPTAQALKLCRHLVLRPPRMEVYQQESRHIRAIFRDYTSLIEPLSLDEAYLDVTHSTQCQGSATWIAKEIRQRIYETRQLTASAGIAPNKSLAKIASDWRKPNGQMVIRPAEVDAFVLTLPVRKLFGVGPKMEERLRQLQVEKCADLQHYSLEFLSRTFGSMGLKLYELARGIDHRPVNSTRLRKSISVEETYPRDLAHTQACLDELPNLITRLMTRVERANSLHAVRHVFVKLKFSNFQQTTVEKVSHHLEYQAFESLIQEGLARHHLPVRLLGIGVRLKPVLLNEHQQLSLDLSV